MSADHYRVSHFAASHRAADRLRCPRQTGSECRDLCQLLLAGTGDHTEGDHERARAGPSGPGSLPCAPSCGAIAFRPASSRPPRSPRTTRCTRRCSSGANRSASSPPLPRMSRSISPGELSGNKTPRVRTVLAAERAGALCTGAELYLRQQRGNLPARRSAHQPPRGASLQGLFLPYLDVERAAADFPVELTVENPPTAEEARLKYCRRFFRDQILFGQTRMNCPTYPAHLKSRIPKSKRGFPLFPPGSHSQRRVIRWHV